jgi:hypothetical protein
MLTIWKDRVSAPRVQATVKVIAFGFVGGGSAIAGVPANRTSEMTPTSVPARNNLMAKPLSDFGFI